MKGLADGSKSLYLDIYRNGKRSYEYLKMYIIPETDDNVRKRNAATMTAANTIKSRRIIELTNGEAGIKRDDDKRNGVTAGLDEYLHGEPAETRQKKTDTRSRLLSKY